jgi:hypothetical protein
VFGKNVIGKPLCGSAVGDVKLKCAPPDVRGRPRGGVEVDIDTKHIDTLPSEGERGSPPDPATSASDERKPPGHGKRRAADPSPQQLPRSRRPVEMFNELPDKPSDIRGLVPNSPVLTSERPPPKPITPGVSGGKKCGRDKGIAGKRDLLNGNGDPPSLVPRRPPHHIGPIKLNPVTGISIHGFEFAQKKRNPPQQLRQNRHLKRPDVPGTNKLPNNVPPPRPTHPVPDLTKIRPRDRGKGSKKLRMSSDSRPRLDRPPVMSDKMHRPTTKAPHDSHQIPH